MNQIILMIKDPLWRSAFESARNLETHSGDSSDLDFDKCIEKHIAVAGPRKVALVMDLEYYNSVEEKKFLKIHRDHLVLLLPDTTDDMDLKDYRRRSVGCFFLVHGQAPKSADLRNFEEFLDSIHYGQISTARLEKYITDSFKDIVDTNLLQVQKKEIESLNQKLEEISRTDALTNLLNRGALMEAMEMEKKRALRSRWRLAHSVEGEKIEDLDLPFEQDYKGFGTVSDHIGNFTCLMVDVDHFKQVNDRFGHLVGDEVLRKFGEIIHTSGVLRDSDVVGRYGGEEFIILLPETNCQNALIPANRLRETIGAQVFLDESGNPFTVTISIGIAEFLPEELDVKELIKRADKALYYAKHNGRNQVCLYSPELFGAMTGEI